MENQHLTMEFQRLTMESKTPDLKNFIDIDNIDTEVSTVSFSYACLCRLAKV